MLKNIPIHPFWVDKDDFFIPISKLVVMLKDDRVTLKIYGQIKLLFILTVKQKKINFTI